jgi:hypothetical protein
LELKSKEEFDDQTADENLSQVRYNHHLYTLMKLLNQLIKERRKINVDQVLKQGH